MGNKAKPIPTIESDHSSKIEVIKNLIFGENIAEYNSEFEEIKAGKKNMHIKITPK